MDLRIRPATDTDLPAIVEIFNQAVRTKKSTGYLEKVTVDDRKAWFHDHSKDYPVLVAEHNNTIVGYVSFEPYRPGRAAFRRTTETSMFIHEDFHRQGIGSQLLTAALATARHAGFTTILAIVLDGNRGSIKLLEKYGFTRCGVLPKVAMIDGNEVSHLYYSLRLHPE